MYPVSRGRGTNWFFAGVIAAFVAFCGSVLAANGQTGNNPNDEGLTIDAVFHRQMGKAVPPYVAPKKWESPVPLTFDDVGRANQLVIRLNYDSPSALRLLAPSLPEAASHSATETALVNAVRGKINGTLAALRHPVTIWYLTDGNRLDETQRGQLAKDDPREVLEQFLVVRYDSVASALDALPHLAKNPAIASATNDFKVLLSSVPNDPYFSKEKSDSKTGTYQWGLQVMNFPAAWDLSTGNSYIGVLEPSAAHTVSRPDDLDGTQPDPLLSQPFVDGNHRAQFDGANGDNTAQSIVNSFHSLHVMGIIGATKDNGIGVAGTCPNCSMSWQTTPQTTSGMAAALVSAVASGMQVVNWSGGIDMYDACVLGNDGGLCSAVLFLQQRQVSLVASAGNGKKQNPQWPASHSAAISVGAAEMREGTGRTLPQSCPDGTSSWCKWIAPDPTYDSESGSNLPGRDGVYAPGRSIVSTVPAGLNYSGHINTRCSDQLNPDHPVWHYGDESGRDLDGDGDGYGSCTGTSMAAPHISGLVGILRSVNPLLPSVDGQGSSGTSIKSIIQQSGRNNAANRDVWGYGMPDALAAVQATIATNQGRLTPLFSLYSAGRSDSFSTIVPQMAIAALEGTLQPRRTTDCEPVLAPPYNPPIPPIPAPCKYSGMGTAVTNYPAFPGVPGGGQEAPAAMAYVFTTPKTNAGESLVPLYRFSWKCGDHTPGAPFTPAICSTNLTHVSHGYSADPVNGLTYFKAAGYKLDGIEGYIYPRSIAQPAGTVKLMRKYNPDRDDIAIFPDSYLWYYTTNGYSQNIGNTDWIGYVYPNTNSDAPRFARAVNMSARAWVEGGDFVVIAGFQIEGSVPKRVQINGRGPSLAGAGLGAHVLADPYLTLYSGSTVIQTDDNSGSSPEARIEATLSPGAYTAILSAKPGTQVDGWGIVEINELDSPYSPLTNLSTRARVESGNSVLIGGMIIAGPVGPTQSVVIRGLGPSLQPYVPPATVVDPVLYLYSGPSIIHTNDNWSASQIPSALQAPMVPGSADAAMSVQLAPGAYTTILSPKQGTPGGMGLLEINFR